VRHARAAIDINASWIKELGAAHLLGEINRVRHPTGAVDTLM
jgi:hypothetical protein